MTILTRTARLGRNAAPLALSAMLAACSLSSLIGGGGKAPPVLYTLTSTAPAPAVAAEQARAGDAVTVQVPIVQTELATIRVPVQVTPTQVQYVTDLQWVDTPDQLFQSLLAETIRRTTGRVVLDPDQTALDPGLVLTGTLHDFGYDAQRGMVVVRYDAALATGGGDSVRSRSFTAEVPADGTAATVAPALNQAANQVAAQVANWIG